MNDKCKMVIELLLNLCSDEYPDLPPEFVPIAYKYGEGVARMAAKFVQNWIKSMFE